MLSEREAALCSAVLALSGTDTMVSLIPRPMPGHQRLDTMSKSAGCLAAPTPIKKRRRHSAELARHFPVCPASAPQRLAWSKHMAGFLGASLSDLTFLICLLSAGHCGETQFFIVAPSGS